MDFSFEGFPDNGVVARIFEVGAEIIPAAVLLGGSPVFLTKIRCAPCSVAALPAGYETFAARPIESLASILEQPQATADRSILPCALMVPPESREEAERLLAKKLIGAPTQRSMAIIAALRQLTGDRERGLDRAAWVGFAAKLLESSAP
jgi:hypothetical protein